MASASEAPKTWYLRFFFALSVPKKRENTTYLTFFLGPTQMRKLDLLQQEQEEEEEEEHETEKEKEQQEEQEQEQEQ